MRICTAERKVFKLDRFYLSMSKPDLEAGLKSLRKSLENMRAMLAWHQLRKAESRPHQPPSFALGDSVQQDLTNEYSFFLFTAMQIHSVLNDSSLIMPEAKRQSIRSQLARIEQQLYSLNLNQKLCTC
jgi:hypothetical protein